MIKLAKAHPYAVLGIDTASISGWAVRNEGRLIASGIVESKDASAVNGVLTTWLRRAGTLTPLVVLERAFGGRRHTVVGLAMARERWLVALRALHVPERRIVSVMPNEWRRGLFGRAWARARRDDIRAYELLNARAEVSCEIDHDEAAAICISRWAANAGELAPQTIGISRSRPRSTR